MMFLIQNSYLGFNSSEPQSLSQASIIRFIRISISFGSESGFAGIISGLYPFFLINSSDDK